jgi:hypothetical protein
MAKRKTLTVEGAEVNFFTIEKQDYISLTDITRKFPDGKQLVPRWIRNRDTLEFLGVWEKLYNQDFQVIEFDNLYAESGKNSFSMSIKRWIETTGAIGFKSKRVGKSPATFAHKDIALGFIYWLSPPFQLYFIKEFQRLKEIEAQEEIQALDWNLKRTLSKLNYTVHTDAIKEELIPPRLRKGQGFIYAGEADILNVAVFGITAKMWRVKNETTKGNIRDYATPEQLLVLSNLEAVNAELLRMKLSEDERTDILNQAAIKQMKSLLSSPSLKKLN